MPGESQRQSSNGGSEAVSTQAFSLPLLLQMPLVNAAVHLAPLSWAQSRWASCTTGGMPEVAAAAAAPGFATPPESPYASSSDGGRTPVSEGSVQQPAPPASHSAGAALGLDYTHSTPPAQPAAPHAAAQGPWLATRAPADAAQAWSEAPGAAGGATAAAAQAHRHLLPRPDAALRLRADAATAAELARLAAAKAAAVAAEDYDEAKRLKGAEERLRVVGARIAVLEAQCVL